VESHNNHDNAELITRAKPQDIPRKTMVNSTECEGVTVCKNNL